MGMTSDTLAWLEDRQALMIDELGEYVSIESGSYDIDGVNRAGKALSQAFQDLGFAIERIPEADCGDHLLARRTGSGTGHLLALIHLDTVWPAGTLAENPFRVENGQAYGPGVLDMKGGWVVLLNALRALDHQGDAGPGQISVFMTADEELGSPSGRLHIESLARQADWVVVMEPARPGGDLCIERSMVGAVYLDVTGRTAHTVANDDRAASAIEEIAHKTLALNALTDRERGVLVNVGTISGGSARQVIPDRATISVDLRAPTTAIGDELVGQVEEIASRQYVPGTTTAMCGGITRPAFEASDGTRRMLALAQECGGDLGMSLKGVASQGGSDGSFTGALGVPTLDGLGPEGANTCSRDEYVLVDSLPRRSALLAGIIVGLPDKMK
ncbi:M20 family metallopeptidase [soil metagenome]